MRAEHDFVCEICRKPGTSDYPHTKSHRGLCAEKLRQKVSQARSLRRAEKRKAEKAAKKARLKAAKKGK